MFATTGRHRYRRPAVRRKILSARRGARRPRAGAHISLNVSCAPGFVDLFAHHRGRCTTIGLARLPRPGPGPCATRYPQRSSAQALFPRGRTTSLSAPAGRRGVRSVRVGMRRDISMSAYSYRMPRSSTQPTSRDVDRLGHHGGEWKTKADARRVSAPARSSHALTRRHWACQS